MRTTPWILAPEALLGCAAPEPAETAARSAALDGLWLQRGPIVEVPPEGGDGAPLFEARWAPDGPAFPELAIAALEWGDAAVVLAADRRLHRFERDGTTTEIATDAFSPVVSRDRAWLAFSRGDPYGPRDVHLLAPGGNPVVVPAVSGASLIAFGPGNRALFLIAASPGGVLGLHVVDVADGARRCLTNCALRTGTPWGDAFVAPPESWEQVDVDETHLRYVDELGRTVRIGWQVTR